VPEVAEPWYAKIWSPLLEIALSPLVEPAEAVPIEVVNPSIFITVPALIAEPVVFFQITKFSLPLALFDVVELLLERNPLSENFMIVSAAKFTHGTNTKLSGAFELNPKIDKSPIESVVCARAVNPINESKRTIVFLFISV
jgi:hypothetical protein